MSRRPRAAALAALLAVLAHTALTWLLAHADEGLLTPEASVSPALLVLGVVTLVVRTAVIVVLPPLVAYFGTQALLRRR